MFIMRRQNKSGEYGIKFDTPNREINIKHAVIVHIGLRIDKMLKHRYLM